MVHYHDSYQDQQVKLLLFWNVIWYLQQNMEASIYNAFPFSN
jgi:hypothetical protein